MNAWQLATAGVIALAALAAMGRTWRQPRSARRIGWIALQPLCALALYFVLYPPMSTREGGTLVVLTSGAAPVQGGDVVALPEAGTPPGAVPVPDLATALRQRPGVARLHVLGEGLPARDREAVGALPLQFQAPAPTPGLVAVSTPPPVAPGNTFDVEGQVVGWPRGRVELLDPAGGRVDAAPLDAQGRFRLRGQARLAGQVLFAVRVLDADGRERDRQPLPLHAVAAPPLRVWILAGAPQPEWKYLRRWAADAGVTLHTQIAVGGGLQLGDAPKPLDVATLSGFDLLWLDERAWSGLSSSQRAAVREAARGGLGVLVRLGGPLDAGARQALAALGLPLHGGSATVPVSWPVADGEAPVMLGKRDFAPDATLPVLAQDAGGTPYAWWRSLGQGRIGVTTLADSWQLPLAGEAAAHGRLWSGVLATLARARPHGGTFDIPAPAWAGERMVICGLTENPQVRDPAGGVHRLIRDPDNAACAAYWPAQAGWHTLGTGEAAMPFYVRDPAQAKAAFAQAQSMQTLRRVTPADAPGALATAQHPGSRWPAWWAFLLLAAACWWLERPRRG
ncbi:carboxypeptidase regulatory-like domain-containing protein [Stenotrophomonas sp. HITSZ_GD]|uniref:carboxypeptidase regulatory-like domain-containing protein n=1 Tax=Stenotrophomonas sp. HITSZ_GD TaxID=3037248 RepID=UPI00240DC525|nr:carboxypeptidase regulatory-like domain-containing protein [Stenotrophomonas sp. HITSZ_GD]MDG2524025.1 carboxypeptidase regulatory-like domain-containing protein [Stenotrophomonas sp. HITSZ_GD]